MYSQMQVFCKCFLEGGKRMNFSAELTLMKQKVQIAEKHIDALLEYARSPMKFNTLLDSAMQQIELACIEVLRLQKDKAILLVHGAKPLLN